MQVNLGNLTQATVDSQPRIHCSLCGIEYKDLLERLLFICQQIHVMNDTHASAFYHFNNYLGKLGEKQFTQIHHNAESGISQDKEKWKVIESIADAILQRDGSQPFSEVRLRDLQALQLTVSSLYHQMSTSFLGISQFPQVARWGKGNEDLYNSHMSFECNDQEVQLDLLTFPAVYRTHGVLAWSTLAHEVGGHSLFRALPGLKEELLKVVEATVKTEFDDTNIDVVVEYFKSCVEEITSDILSTLNIGPSGGVALIGYLRSQEQSNKLSCVGRWPERGEDVHPIPVLRAYAACKVIEFMGSGSSWVPLLETEIAKDHAGISKMSFHNIQMDLKQAGQIHFASVLFKAITAAIATTKLKCLNGKLLLDLIQWKEKDELAVLKVRSALRDGKNFPGGACFSRHILAAAILESVDSASQLSITAIFEKMKEYLRDASQTTNTGLTRVLYSSAEGAQSPSISAAAAAAAVVSKPQPSKTALPQAAAPAPKRE